MDTQSNTTKQYILIKVLESLVEKNIIIVQSKLGNLLIHIYRAVDTHK